jgi:hypothetical protein
MGVTAGGEDDQVIVNLARTGTLSPTRAAELEAKLARAVAATRAPATLRAYRADWADFTVWCHTLGVAPLPAAPAVLAAYLSELAQPATTAPRRRWPPSNGGCRRWPRPTGWPVSPRPASPRSARDRDPPGRAPPTRSGPQEPQGRGPDGRRQGRGGRHRP